MNTVTCAYCGADHQDGLGTCPFCGMAQATPRALPKGTELQGGRFAIDRVLGEGSFGITYKGIHKPLQRTVALKELFPEGAVRDGARVLVPADRQDNFRQDRESILHEARLVARLDSPNIVNVHDMFLENGTVYIAMEYLEGQTLQERIDSAGRLPLAEVQKIALDACEALTEIHSCQLLHRDLKPANIMLAEDLRTVLIDFGSAREYGARQTRHHTRILTEDYAAPEQYSDQARFGPYTDIFCLGATLFHALTGTPPPGALKRLLHANLTVNFPAGLQGPLRSAIQQALALKVQDRPQSINALRDILLGLDTDVASASAPQTPSTLPPDTFSSVDRGLFRKASGDAGRLAPQGLMLATAFVVLFGAAFVATASGVVPFHSLAATFVSVSRPPTPTLASSPTATLQLVVVVPTSMIPTFTPTPVAPKPAPTKNLKRTATPTPVLLQAHTNTGANLRSGPGVGYELVGVLTKNSEVQPVSLSADRLWLKLNNGTWIYAALVDDIPSRLPLEAYLPVPSPPTATPIPPTATPVPTIVPVQGDWSLPVPRDAPFLMQDGLEIRIIDVIYRDEDRMQSYIEPRRGQRCRDCLAVRLEIDNRKGNEREYVVQEDFKLLKGDPDATPYPQVECQNPNALRSMANPGYLRGLPKPMGRDERILCFKGVVELSLDLRLAYSPVFLYEEKNTPTPTPAGSLHRAHDLKEQDQTYRTGWSVFFHLLGI